MALIQLDCFSHTLELSVSLNVILPQDRIGARASSPDAGLPTLYLLHGLSDDHTAWVRQTAIERYANARGLAVVMPAVNRSFYADTAWGQPYWSYVSEELPELMRRFFPLSAARENNFVAGLSMGGYGAFKLALHRPERFAAAASLSGALDIAASFDSDRGKEWDAFMTRVFGDMADFRGSGHDLLHAAERLVDRDGDRPRLYQCCGTEDFLYQQNLRFRDHARQLGLDLNYHEHEGFGHTWDYWDARIAEVIGWLPVRE